MLIESLLTKLGLHVMIVEDGNEAVEKVMSEDFDMIFMDMMMPNMNGYEATEALRKKSIKTPIVAWGEIKMFSLFASMIFRFF